MKAAEVLLLIMVHGAQTSYSAHCGHSVFCHGHLEHRCTEGELFQFEEGQKISRAPIISPINPPIISPTPTPQQPISAPVPEGAKKVVLTRTAPPHLQLPFGVSDLEVNGDRDR